MSDDQRWGGQQPPGAQQPPAAPAQQPPVAPQQPWGGAPQPGVPQQPWGGAPQPGIPQQPWAGAPQQPWGAAPQPGPGVPGPAQNGGWRPPPKPGLVPLRPLTLGEILGATFQVMRRNPAPTFGIALLLQVIAGVVSTALVGGVLWATISRVDSAASADQDAIVAGGVAAGIVAGLVGLALNLVVTAIIQGLVTLEVARGTLGERLRLGGMWRRIRPRVGALIGWVSLFTGVNIVVIGGFAAALFALGSLGEAAIGVAIALAVILALAYAVVGAWLGVKLIYVPSAITLERLGVRAAIRRSWTLIRGSFWKTLGIYLLVYVIYYAASQIISTPLGIVLGVVGGLLGTGGDETSATVTIVVVYAASIILSLVVGAIGTVMLSATTALLYLDLRMRREGLDLELTRFVEARAAGQTELRDPYEPLPNGAGGAGYGAPGAAGSPTTHPGAGPAAPGGTVYPPSSGSPWA
ncbi:glycerophosphoryl diester phosphodiesterase membrane domain-containing protein [Schumannella soli]|uniref:DUF7847 domain-containing protein n=1 Tax=Schumannella soli TaxID=2590779 RepID=A0A506Y9S5_9MICO|nr:glycerophosphoryl diester phosphodiesterase membrane domain-containing protein [Schumannella soli]TPW77209.1 hypothetical protein FJ657_00410 [Schumannella soli]